MNASDGLRPSQRDGDASEPVGAHPWVGEGLERHTGPLSKFSPRDRSGFRGFDWNDPALLAAINDASLSIEVQLWRRTFDPLTAPCWWQWREPCDCDLIARERTRTRPRHRWNCALTPIWAQTMRELDVNPLWVHHLPYVSRNFQAQWRNA
jgi:hypothetical protein